MSDDEYVHVGDHADILASARSIGPGERVSSSELTDAEGNIPHANQVLIDEGVLVNVDSFDQGEHNGEAVKEAAKAESAPAPVPPAAPIPPAPAATESKQEGDSNANA